jgi:hypothetical protein
VTGTLLPVAVLPSTDCPHIEGGTDPIGRMAGDIEPLGADAFFVGNAGLILPT